MVDLATDPRFHARLLIAIEDDDNEWPQLLDGSTDPAAACFEEVALPVPADPAEAAALAPVRVFRITCDAAPVAAATLP